MMYLSFPVLVMWWGLALDQQSESHPCKSKHCWDSSKCSHHQMGKRIVILHKGESNEPYAILVTVPDNRDCSGVIHQLLMQSGDVETNPGPGNYE